VVSENLCTRVAAADLKTQFVRPMPASQRNRSACTETKAPLFHQISGQKIPGFFLNHPFVSGGTKVVESWRFENPSSSGAFSSPDSP